MGKGQAALVTYPGSLGWELILKVLLGMLHVDPVSHLQRAPWAAGRNNPLSMAHCLKT